MRLYVGSILDVNADAVVNPANSFMRHCGGLAAVIDRAASECPKGYRLRDDGSPSPSQARYEASLARAAEYERHRDSAPLIPTGSALAGPGGNSGFKRIIHAVGPIWGGGILCEHDLLELAVDNACLAATAVGAKSIAIPAISCGVFGFPVKYAAPIIVSAASWHEFALDITFAVMGREYVEAFTKEVQDA